MFYVLIKKGLILKIIVKTLHGLEPLLADELRALGAQSVQPLKRAVECIGDKRLLYRANLELRTALRVLQPVAEFQAKTPDDLYRHVRRIDWSDYLGLDKTFAIDATTSSDIFRHSQYAALRTKDAIADYFRDKTGQRPSVNVVYPHLRINLHIHQYTCVLSLDSSGDSLHKRGYRADTVDAPLNEVLAAGMLLFTGWNGSTPLVDPMCGSGTLLIEGAWLATRTPPQWHKSSLGFMKWRNFDADLWEDVRQEAKAAMRELHCDIRGYDKDMKAIRATGQNIFSAHLEGQHLQVQRQSFEKLLPPAASGVLIMNPPYDERLKNPEIEAFYKMIGDRLKQIFTGYDAWIISSNSDALKYIGLKPSQKITLFNGALECKYQHYELYAGSKKILDQ